MTTSMATRSEPPNTITVQSSLLGSLTVPAELCLTFPDGLLGFPRNQRFVLLPATPNGILWLQGVDDESLIFLVVDPYVYFSDYGFELTKVDRLATGVTEESDTAVLAIVTLPRHKGVSCTVNLQGPLFVDFTTRRGWQVILADSSYGTQHDVELALNTAPDCSSSPTSGR